MTIAEMAYTNAVPSLNQFVKKLVGDRCCLGLLRFFGAHPNSRFSKLAVVHAIDENGGRLKIEKALTRLVSEGIINIHVENNNYLYRLTGEEKTRRMVLSLSDLDWPQWQLALGHI